MTDQIPDELGLAATLSADAKILVSEPGGPLRRGALPGVMDALLAASDPFDVLERLGLGWMRPITQFGSYGSADDTATWQAAIDSGEAFFVPPLQAGLGDPFRRSKVAQIVLKNRTTILGYGFLSGIEALPEAVETIITEPYVTGINLECLDLYGNWEAQPPSATGVAHMLHIGTAASYEEGVSFANSQVRVNSAIKSVDPRHRVNVRVSKSAGIGVYWQGRGASVIRIETMECFQGAKMATYDNEIYFDIGGSATHNLEGNGYTGNNWWTGKSWYAGQGSGNAGWMKAKLEAAGIDPFADYYDLYLLSSKRNQFRLQTQDAAGTTVFMEYCTDNELIGHLEGPADAVYADGIDIVAGKDYGKPNSSAITLKNCINNTIRMVGINREAMVAGLTLPNAKWLIDFQGNNTLNTIELNSRGWAESELINGTYANRGNYVRINDVVYSQRFAKDSQGKTFIGTDDGVVGLSNGMVTWNGGDPFGNGGTLDFSFWKQVRYQFQDEVTRAYSTIAVFAPGQFTLPNLKTNQSGGVAKAVAPDLPLQLKSYLKADLPDGTGLQPGAMVFVPDAAGGSQPAFWDSIQWLRVADRTLIT